MTATVVLCGGHLEAEVELSPLPTIVNGQPGRRLVFHRARWDGEDVATVVAFALAATWQAANPDEAGA
jgi:hypothetical protein